jgi:hypothetical protein
MTPIYETTALRFDAASAGKRGAVVEVFVFARAESDGDGRAKGGTEGAEAALVLSSGRPQRRRRQLTASGDEVVQLGDLRRQVL